MTAKEGGSEAGRDGTGGQSKRQSPHALSRKIWGVLFAGKLRRPTADKPRLIVMSGLPLSGKTHLARRIVKASASDVAHIENDHVRRLIVQDAGLPAPRYTKEEHGLTYGTSHELIRRALQNGFHVIFDATNLNESYRRAIYAVADANGAEIIVIRTHADMDETMARSEARKSGTNGSGHSDADTRVYNILIEEDEPIARCSRPYLTFDSSREDADAFIRKNGLALS